MEADEKDKLYKIRSYSEQTFDKLLVYLAGGGLILTIGFVKEVVNLSSAKTIYFLFLTWISFTISLTFNLISHKTSTTSVDSYLKNEYDKGDKWNKFTHYINFASIIVLFLGILLFIIFVINNI